jgi:hypothetical protein
MYINLGRNILMYCILWTSYDEITLGYNSIVNLTARNGILVLLGFFS